MHPHIFLEILKQISDTTATSAKNTSGSSDDNWDHFILLLFCAFKILSFLFILWDCHAYNVFWSYPSPILSLDSPPLPPNFLSSFKICNLPSPVCAVWTLVGFGPSPNLSGLCPQIKFSIP